MIKNILTAIFFLILSCTGKAQDKSVLRFHLQGFNLVFPGVEIAYQSPIIKYAFNEEKQNKFFVSLSPVVDFYVQKKNHTGIGLMGEVNLQYQSSRRFIYEIYGGFGMLAAILSGEVYELNSQGDFEKSKLKGNIYQSWKTGIGISKMVSTKSNKMLAYHLRVGVRHAKTPGAFIIPNVSLGVNFILNKKESKNVEVN
jgi:hypothetical protein